TLHLALASRRRTVRPTGEFNGLFDFVRTSRGRDLGFANAATATPICWHGLATWSVYRERTAASRARLVTCFDPHALACAASHPTRSGLTHHCRGFRDRPYARGRRQSIGSGGVRAGWVVCSGCWRVICHRLSPGASVYGR